MELPDTKARALLRGSWMAAGADAAGNPTARTEVEIILARLRQMGVVTSDSGRTGVAEDFRIIRRPLLHSAGAAMAAGAPNGNLIVVTSALPGEGKTWCTVNLAMNIAMERDHRVLLVDADVARPSVLKLLGLAPAPGLMDILLSDRRTLADVLLHTNIPNLSLLPPDATASTRPNCWPARP